MLIHLVEAPGLLRTVPKCRPEGAEKVDTVGVPVFEFLYDPKVSNVLDVVLVTSGASESRCRVHM